MKIDPDIILPNGAKIVNYWANACIAFARKKNKLYEHIDDFYICTPVCCILIDDKIFANGGGIWISGTLVATPDMTWEEIEPMFIMEVLAK